MSPIFFSDNNWCFNGTYGSNWGNRGFFISYQRNGFTALNCPQCGCQGNKTIFPINNLLINKFDDEDCELEKL